MFIQRESFSFNLCRVQQSTIKMTENQLKKNQQLFLQRYIDKDLLQLTQHRFELKVTV